MSSSPPIWFLLVPLPGSINKWLFAPAVLPLILAADVPCLFLVAAFDDTLPLIVKLED